MDEKKVYSWKTLKKGKAFSFLFLVLISILGLMQAIHYSSLGIAAVKDSVFDVREGYLKKEGSIIVEVRVVNGESFEKVQKKLENGALIKNRWGQFLKLNKKFNLDYIVAGESYYFVANEDILEKVLNETDDVLFKNRIKIIGHSIR